MKLRLNVRERDGSRHGWEYDNVTNELWREGELLDLSKDGRLSQYMSGQTHRGQVFSDSKSKDLYDLRIQLGLRCNMHCRYCAQSDRALEKVCWGPKDVPAFIAKLKAGNVNVTGVIELWGGEPFVYWKTIKNLVPQLREMYPNVRFAMITNGTLLTEDKISFCEKYRIDLTFSHDGQGYQLRGADPLDDPKMVDLWRLAFSKLRCNINCVLSPANTDIEQIIEHIHSRLGAVPINFEGIMTHVGVTDKELMFSDKQLLTLQKNIFTAMTSGPWAKFPALEQQCRSLIQMLVNRKRLNPRAVKCCMHSPDNAAVNLNGDVLSCHDHCTPDKFVGRIEDLEGVDISRCFKPWSERPECRRCLVLSMCRGACPQIEGLARTLTCKNEFAYKFAIFQSVFWLLFGLTLESYAPAEG
ncbi:radical SAM protein [Mesosutterella sp. AGMB02718]|uniref:Radical SAM protein n=1 Tax=Mesosutterella faecium TaxID=2925194 RepID=A0ABT7IJ10_9BURK|nr:radical SAM protein [Mesosutterella sp. AGMB02718]MDL2058372.1 radical SAM protein [Mesosutterella sp. AGMB02718]MDL2060608.1 radical SAM protein [Mesosutterella sp. AGMB02718]